MVPSLGHCTLVELGLCVEAFGFLVVPPVFKTGEIEYLGLAGSIPVRLRRIEET